jgi:hypothetical protein
MLKDRAGLALKFCLELTDWPTPTRFNVQGKPQKSSLDLRLAQKNIYLSTPKIFTLPNAGLWFTTLSGQPWLAHFILIQYNTIQIYFTQLPIVEISFGPVNLAQTLIQMHQKLSNEGTTNEQDINIRDSYVQSSTNK